MTEFYAGMLVADFATDYREAFARLCHRAGVPLTELLPEVITPGKGVLVVLSGIDYRTMRPTPQTRIERLA